MTPCPTHHNSTPPAARSPHNDESDRADRHRAGGDR